MTSLTLETHPKASSVLCTEDQLVVSLVDGRVLSVPLAWFPRLLGAQPAQLENVELLGDGDGIHWPELDEDLSIAGLLKGHASLEQAGSAA